MNKNEWQQLLDEIRHNESIGCKAMHLVNCRSVLAQKDLVKTRVWWLLSKDFPKILGEKVPHKQNTAEMRAFLDFITGNLVINDFKKQVAELEYKVDNLAKKHNWNIIELIIVDTLMRKYSGNKELITRKWSFELDNEYKTDIISSYMFGWNTHRFWIQLTTGKEHMNKKDTKIREVLSKIDDWSQGKKFSKNMELDSMIFIKLNWTIKQILSESENSMQEALSAWENAEYEWNILDFIENTELVKEINRFCDLYLFILNNFFLIITKDIQRKWFMNKVIELPTWERIDINYSERDKTVSFKVGEWNINLFSTKFFLNNKLVNKINDKEGEIIIKTTYWKPTQTVEWAILIDKYRNDEITKGKIEQLIQTRTVLDSIDLIKTKIWGLLSKDYLETRNIAEIRAFQQYLSTRYSLVDFDKSIERIIAKADWLLYGSDWYILEFLIIDTLMRNHQHDKWFSNYKWTPSLDSIYKTDMITANEFEWVNYKFWAQLTTTHVEEILTDKDREIRAALRKIDKWEQKWNYIKKAQLDSMILVQLNWEFSSCLHKPISPLKIALKKWKKSGFNWNLIDYIAKKELVIEVKRFSMLYSYIINNFFQLINTSWNAIRFKNKVIKLAWWEKVEIEYIQNEKRLNCK